MILNLNENDIGVNDPTEATPEDMLMAKEADPNSEEALDVMAAEVDSLCAESALTNIDYFENGAEARAHFTESAEVQTLMEARKFAKSTYVRLNKNDDLNRRTHLAALVLAKEHNDALWKKLAQNRVRERQLRSAIFKKYINKAKLVARKSQIVHQKKMRKMPALPKIMY